MEVVLCGGFVLNRNETAAETEIENVLAFVHSSDSFKEGGKRKLYELSLGLPDQSPARPERAERLRGHENTSSFGHKNSIKRREDAEK